MARRGRIVRPTTRRPSGGATQRTARTSTPALDAGFQEVRPLDPGTIEGDDDGSVVELLSGPTGAAGGTESGGGEVPFGQDGPSETGDGDLGSGTQGDDPNDDLVNAFGGPKSGQIITDAPLPGADLSFNEPTNTFAIAPVGAAGHPTVDDYADGWLELDVAGPCVLMPRGQVTRYPVLFGPNTPPKERRDCMRSRGQGIVHLPSRGKWYLKLDTFYEGTTHGAVDYLIIDSRSPWAGSRALQELSSSSVMIEGAATTQGVGTQGIVLADDPYRTAFCVSGQSLIANSYGMIGFDVNPTAAQGIFLSTLAPSAGGQPTPLFMSDAFAVKRNVRLFAAVGDVTHTTIAWID